MKLVEQIQNLQKEKETSMILVKNGIFFIGVGRDAILLHEMLGLKLTCMKQNLCKVGFLVKNVESYIRKMQEKNISFCLYIKNEKGELEQIYHYQGKQVEENRECLECKECENRKENEEDILERVRKLGKPN